MAYLPALQAAGVQVAALDLCHPAHGVVLIFFHEFSRGLSDFVSECSRGGLERVLAISVAPPASLNNCAWRLLHAGASDVFAWEHSRAPAAEVAARLARWEEVDQLAESLLVKNNLVGASAAWKAALRQIVEVSHFSQSAILITGESGTGKELAARLIHTLDPRPHKRDLVTLDCTTVVPELSGSEFFGHERGSYTGAVTTRDGAFALADGGTLFLDEVGELSPRLQSELLRVVQERTYKRVGSNNWQGTNFRLVCATNRDLREEEARGQFRRDFYHRIASWTCHLPPLRERAGDTLLLVRHFLKELCPDTEPPPLDEAVQEYLLKRDYAGNVRELKGLVMRMVSRHVGPGPITVGDIKGEDFDAEAAPPDWRDAPFECAIRRALALGVGLKEIGSAATETAISIAVGDEQGNLQRAARKLGVTDRALQLRRASRWEAGKSPTNGTQH